MRLRGDVGARDLLRNAASVAAEQLSLDVDTEADAKAAEQYLANESLRRN